MTAPVLTGFGPPARWIRWTALLLILLGVGLRLRQYETNRSLWKDESMLALNIVERSATDLMLMNPAIYGQCSPTFFLLAEKAITGAFGRSEYALRLLPLAGGILALLLLWIAARRFIGGAGALTALALFAISERLIYYSSEVKQYSTDAAVTVVLLLIGRWCVSSAMRPRDYLLLGVAGAVALWSSHPATFVLAGIGLAAGIDLLARRDMRRLRWLLTTGLLWSGSLAILYFASLRSLIAGQETLQFWTQFYMPMPPWLHSAWLQKSFVNLIRGFVGIPYSGLVAAMILAGCVSLASRNWRLAVILIAPFPAALLASGLRMYPFGNRLLLFSLPLLFLLIGEAAERIRSLLLRLNRAAAWAAWAGVTAVLLYSPACVALQNAHTPKLGEHIRPTLAYLSEHRQSGDAIYVYYSSVPAVRFYGMQFGIHSNDYIASLKSRSAPEEYASDVARLAGRERAWFVFSHPCRWCPVDEEALFLQNMDGIGARIDEFKAPGAAVYLYDLRGRQKQPAPR